MTEPHQPDPSEEEPEEPDLGASVQLEAGETLDGPPGSDGLDASYVAPDRPFVLDDPSLTPDGQREGDTLDERMAREVPDDAPDAASGPAPDLVTGEIGSEAGQGRSGRLTADTADPDGWANEALEADDAGVSGGAASAEEAAVHDIGEDEIEPDVDDEGAEIPEVPEGPDIRLRGDDADPAIDGR